MVGGFPSSRPAGVSRYQKPRVFFADVGVEVRDLCGLPRPVRELVLVVAVNDSLGLVVGCRRHDHVGDEVRAATEAPPRRLEELRGTLLSTSPLPEAGARAEQRRHQGDIAAVDGERVPGRELLDRGDEVGGVAARTDDEVVAEDLRALLPFPGNCCVMRHATPYLSPSSAAA
jgi:hypothetical protein